jgi:hypothetical protein
MCALTMMRLILIAGHNGLADDRLGGTMTVQCRKGKDDRPDECCGECAVDPLVKQPAEPLRKLFEISAMVSYSVVIAAETREAALEHVKTWEHAWDSSSDLIGVSDVEIIDVREPGSQDRDVLEDEAHEVV